MTFRTDGSGAHGFDYDPAGNLIGYVTANSKPVTQQFDALGRLVRRTSIAVHYGEEKCVGHAPGPITGLGCFVVFPYFPNASGSGMEDPTFAPGEVMGASGLGEMGPMSGGITGYRVSGDTAKFHYDVMGNLVQANNPTARVRRTYFPNGQLKTDTLEIRPPDLTHYTRGQRYTYDLSGRRLTMEAEGTFQYLYDGHGPLKKITDPLGNRYEWSYDRMNRDTAWTVAPPTGGAGSYGERVFDAEGRLIKRTVMAWQNNQWHPILADDSIKYDLRGKVRDVWSDSKMHLSEWASAAYDGLGAMHLYERTRAPGLYEAEEMRHNAYGETVWSKTQNSAAGSFSPFDSRHSAHGGLFSRSTKPYVGLPPQFAYSDTMYQAFVGAGVVRMGKITEAANGGAVTNQVVARHYYDGLNRLATVQRYSYRQGGDDGTWEEYRYDALGRRVLTRVRRTGTPPAGSNALCQSSTGVCRSYIERVWWDGDQILREERVAESSPNSYNSGVVVNVHGLQLDQPVAAIRNGAAHVLNYTWRGLAESAILPSGAYSACRDGAQTCSLQVPFAHRMGAYYTPAPDESGSSPSLDTWLGSLPENGAGSTGMLYRRNRYYDPATGQFTQEDPIGLAGGLNLYGYANGDPINFSDPFGLDPCWYGPDGVWCPDPDAPEDSSWGLLKAGFLGVARYFAGDGCDGMEVNGEPLVCGMGPPIGRARRIRPSSVDAKSLVEYQKHVRDLEQARERLAHLQQQLMRVKGPKRQQRIRDQIERVERKIKGHEKEIRQKWPDGAPEK